MRLDKWANTRTGCRKCRKHPSKEKDPDHYESTIECHIVWQMIGGLEGPEFTLN